MQALFPSWTRASARLPPLCVSPQIPRVITRGPSRYAKLLPVEVLGWLLRSLLVFEGCWVLIGTADDSCEIATQLSMRGPVSVNVVVGHMLHRNNEAGLAALAAMAHDHVTPGIKEANGLSVINWDQAHPFTSQDCTIPSYLLAGIQWLVLAPRHVQAPFFICLASVWGAVSH